MSSPEKCLYKPGEPVRCAVCGEYICEECVPEDTMCERCEECGKLICWDCVQTHEDGKTTCAGCHPEVPGARAMGLPTDVIASRELRDYIAREITALENVLQVTVVGGPVLLRLKDGFEVLITFHPNRKVKSQFEHRWLKKEGRIFS